MTKQEFIGFSINTGLKVLRGDNETILEVSGIHGNSLLFTERNSSTYGNILHSKPICRPISDLAKEIEHGGEKFVPIEKLNELFGYKDVRLVYYTNSGLGWIIDGSYSNTAINFKDMYNPIQKLIEWHFAIGLDKCDYVDVNTLETNPYK